MHYGRRSFILGKMNDLTTDTLGETTDEKQPNFGASRLHPNCRSSAVDSSCFWSPSLHTRTTQKAHKNHLAVLGFPWFSVFWLYQYTWCSLVLFLVYFLPLGELYSFLQAKALCIYILIHICTMLQAIALFRQLNCCENMGYTCQQQFHKIRTILRAKPQGYNHHVLSILFISILFYWISATLSPPHHSLFSMRRSGMPAGSAAHCDPLLISASVVAVP